MKLEQLNEKELIDLYVKFCYRIGLQKHIDKKPLENIAKSLYQADVDMTPGMFISVTIVSAAILSILIFPFSFLLFFRMENPIFFIMGIPFLAFILVIIGAPFTIFNKIESKKLEIERNLPYALGFMSVIASAGSTPIDVIRRISVEDYGPISTEFGKVVYEVDFLGGDVISSMRHLIQNTPSETFRGICIDFTNIIESGGGLKEYLIIKTGDVMEIRRQTLKVFVESLSVFAELYLGGIVMIIILSIIGIIVATILGMEFGPLSAKSVFTMLIYGVIPTANIIFLTLLWSKYNGSPV